MSEEELAYGAERCPICNAINIPGEVHHCIHYVGLLSTEGFIFEVTFLEKFNQTWEDLLYVYGELLDEKCLGVLGTTSRSLKRKNVNQQIIEFLDKGETDLEKIISSLSQVLLDDDCYPKFGYIEEKGKTVYSLKPKKLQRLQTEVSRILIKGEQKLERIFNPKPVTKTKVSIVKESNVEITYQEKENYLPGTYITNRLKSSDTYFKNIQNLKEYYKIDAPIKLSASFYLGFVSISCHNKPWFSPKISWGKLIKRELGFIPKNENDWEVVWAAYNQLPPQKFKNLINKLSKFQADGQIESTKQLVDYSDELGETYVRPSAKALAYDVVKSLNIGNWLLENNFSCKINDNLMNPFRAIDRGFGFTGRHNASILSKFLMEDFEIVLDLPS
jgi:hypothetical protein